MGKSSLRKRVLWIGLAVVLLAAAASLTFLASSRWQPKPAPSPHGSRERNHEGDGPASNSLPWAGRPEVEAALREHKTPVLMASYKTTLPDPILEEQYNIARAADSLAGAVVGPGEVFSLGRHLGPCTRARGYRMGPMYEGNRIVPVEGGGICKIASTLYNVVILANLAVVERHPHSMTVPYVPPGQDATISYGSLDFRFRNTTPGPLLIWADTRGNSLYIAIYGRTRPPKVTWHHETLSTRKAATQYRTNRSLPPGVEKVVSEGRDGVTVRSWLTVEMPDGTIQRKDLGTDSYASSPRIVERGPG